MKILLIDDDAELCAMLAEYLGAEGFEVTVCGNGEAGTEAAVSGAYDAVVLDIMLPRMSGIDVLRAIRQRAAVPVLMLTAKGSDVDRVVGLELGADDYLPKPCYPRELVARLRAVLRRTQHGGGMPGTGQGQGQGQGTGPADQLAAAGVVLQPAQRIARFADTLLELTVTEFNLLEYLLRNVDRAISKDELSERILGRAREAYDRSVDVHIGKLRQKLAAAGGPDHLIATVWGFGYRLESRPVA
ncbi:DNA-binding response regulator [Cupriavidus sp. USMAHM13]|uniref:DNA-binding response regulator n=2 Tax=Burkholderiaceae TaxID=119060 RepID=A0ABM6FE48_9BURK|nr:MULTISPECIES: response regulator transcription factor [Cupriavidus]AOZ02521.1 DNA-binding response regulator [Cupriavidus sp. USMAHM13]AOZ10124.1 DNA-binding response regulator [Cupriavidus malaysiensis]